MRNGSRVTVAGERQILSRLGAVLRHDGYEDGLLVVFGRRRAFRVERVCLMVGTCGEKVSKRGINDQGNVKQRERGRRMCFNATTEEEIEKAVGSPVPESRDWSKKLRRRRKLPETRRDETAAEIENSGVKDRHDDGWLR